MAGSYLGCGEVILIEFASVYLVSGTRYSPLLQYDPAKIRVTWSSTGLHTARCIPLKADARSANAPRPSRDHREGCGDAPSARREGESVGIRKRGYFFAKRNERRNLTQKFYGLIF